MKNPEAEDAFAEIAWRDFILFAWGHPPIRERFTAETGLTPTAAPASAIEAMVDDATGQRAEVLTQFIAWATREIWGDEYAPEAYRKAHKLPRAKKARKA